MSLASNYAKPTTADMEHWLASLPQYALCSTDTAMATGVLSAHLKDIDDLIVKSPPAPDDKAPFEQARQQVKGRIDVFARTPFWKRSWQAAFLAAAAMRSTPTSRRCAASPAPKPSPSWRADFPRLPRDPGPSTTIGISGSNRLSASQPMPRADHSPD